MKGLASGRRAGDFGFAPHHLIHGETLSQNRLAILPDLTHYEIGSSPRLATTVLPFLNGQSDAKSWAEQVAKPSK